MLTFRKNDVVGKFKIETSESLVIDNIVTLRAKAFADTHGEEEYKKLEGITKSALENVIFNQNENCLDNELTEEKKGVKKFAKIRSS